MGRPGPPTCQASMLVIPLIALKCQDSSTPNPPTLRLGHRRFLTLEEACL